MRNYKNILALIAISSFIFAGCGADSSVDVSDAVENLISVESVKISENIVENYYISFGEVIPYNQVDIQLNGSGEIEQIYVSSGDAVNKGDALIKLSSDQVEANYSSQESQLRTVRDTLKLQLDVAKDNYLNQMELFKSGFATKASIESIENQIKTLEAQYRDASNNYNNQVNNLKKTVNDRVIRSTIDGKVGAIYVRQGQTIGGQKAISIIDSDRLLIKTMVTSELIRATRIGMPVEIKNIKNEIAYGEIINIDKIPNPSNKLYAVEASILSSDYEALIGDFVEVKFVTEEYSANTVPSVSIVYEGTQAYIFLLEGDIVKKIAVSIGNTKDEYVEIIADDMKILDGEVIVKGQQFLRNEERVKVNKN